MGFDAEQYLRRLDSSRSEEIRGRVSGAVGLTLRAVLPGAFIGEQVEIRTPRRDPLPAEVVGFSEQSVVLMPLGDPEGIGPDAEVVPAGRPPAVLCGEALIGRVLDGLGRPMDDGGPLEGLTAWPIARPAPDPLTRRPVEQALPLGVRALDGPLTVGEGQRVGLFAPAGVGKSTLLAQIARNTDAEVIVLALVGERGREVREFLEHTLGSAGRARSVVVCATADSPALLRRRAAFVATSVAEYFREHDRRVLLLLDSLTRVARAQREVGLAAGEPPVRRGFPPSAFALLPRLLERAGNSDRGTLTAIYTVLVEGADMDEPVADEVRGILDGHVVLSRELATRGRWPAIDLLTSVSRVFRQVATPEQVGATETLRALLGCYERRRDLIALGAYEKGSDAQTDRALELIGPIERYLSQQPEERSTLEQARQDLIALLGGAAR